MDLVGLSVEIDPSHLIFEMSSICNVFCTPHYIVFNGVVFLVTQKNTLQPPVSVECFPRIFFFDFYF